MDLLKPIKAHTWICDVHECQRILEPEDYGEERLPKGNVGFWYQEGCWSAKTHVCCNMLVLSQWTLLLPSERHQLFVGDKCFISFALWVRNC